MYIVARDGSGDFTLCEGERDFEDGRYEYAAFVRDGLLRMVEVRRIDPCAAPDPLDTGILYNADNVREKEEMSLYWRKQEEEERAKEGTAAEEG